MFKILISTGVLAVSISAANAAPKCPPGEIYRITQKVCMDKADAIRVGIRISSPKTTKVITRSPDAEGAKQAAGPDIPSHDATSDAALTDKQSAFAQAPRTANPAPFASAVGAAKSPYGALLDLGRADTISVSPQARFSLQLATQD